MYRKVISFGIAILVAAILWGALAFGAVYPWAYWPLAVVAVLVASIGFGAPRTLVPPRLGLFPLAAAFSALLAAIAVQLIPLDLDVVRTVSPHAPDILRQLEPAAAAGVLTSHPLSLAPSNTLRGLAMFGTLGLLVLGGARLFSVAGVRRMAQAIAIAGVLLALVGIIQRPLLTGKIYGFWPMAMGGNPFGPFINKNHFAGWMLMALPIPLSLMGGAIARAAPGATTGIRERVMWLASPDASQILLWIAASAVMGLSLIMTMSRSGIAAAGLVALAAGAYALRGDRRARGTATVFLIIAVMAFVVVAWIGGEAIAGRFGDMTWASYNGRKGAWLDAIDIARRYPLVGTGLNTYGVATLFYQKHDLWAHYAQAHNDYLQLAAEGGLLLVLPAVACVAAFCIVVRSRFREDVSVSTSWIRAGAVTGLAAVSVQETVEFSLQMPGNAFLFAVLCAIALHRRPERQRRTHSAGAR